MNEASLHPSQTSEVMKDHSARVGSAEQQRRRARTSEVIHFLWPLQLPSSVPLAGSHSRMLPSMSPLAMYFASGDQLTTSTQLRWPLGARGFEPRSG